MNSGIALGQVALVIAVLVFVVGKRFTPRPVRGDTRRWRMPLVLVVLGVTSLTSLGHRHPPVTITGTDTAFLIAAALISLILGVLRGFTVHVFSEAGQLMQRYSLLTAALWIATVAVRAGLDLTAPSLGVGKPVASASLMLMFGISLLGEALAVTARTGGFPGAAELGDRDFGGVRDTLR
jgi:hypothetical protein